MWLNDFGTIGLIIMMIWMFFLIIALPQIISATPRVAISRLHKSLNELERWAGESRGIALTSLTKYGKPKRDIEKELDGLIEFFAIEPVHEDPAGVIRRLEHVLDVRKKRFESVVARLAPKADKDAAANLEMTVEGAMAGYFLFRIMRHLTLLAKKTKNIYLMNIVLMQMPFIRNYAKAFRDATEAFSLGKPIGDGVGAMVATHLIGGKSCREPVEDTVVAETELDGRKLLVVKAKGPGGRVGKPGELIKRLAQRRKISRIIMIDGALKLEGETSGQVVEGVGAAIGGPPVDKYKIEEIAVGRKIPVDAIIIKESFKEAITPMNSQLAKATEATVAKVKQAVRERTKRGDVVIVAGIGNTIGIGQDPKLLPKEFPAPEEEKAIVSDRLLFRS